MNTNDITEQYLNKLISDMTREQNTLITSLSSVTTKKKEQFITRQIALINTIHMSVIKLNNLRKRSIEE